MEIREPDTALSKAVQIGSLNLSPERSHVRESEIISDDEEEIGPFCHCGLNPSLGFGNWILLSKIYICEDNYNWQLGAVARKNVLDVRGNACREHSTPHPILANRRRLIETRSR
jgi:hypothetical protein